MGAFAEAERTRSKMDIRRECSFGKTEQTRCRVDNKQKSNVHYRGEKDNILTPRQIWSFCYTSILFLVCSAPFQIKKKTFSVSITVLFYTSF